MDLRNCCHNEIELRDRVLSSKRILLRNFFTFYLKQLMIVNEQLNASYLTKLRDEYTQLREKDKITVLELQETIEEMEIDEQSKAHLYHMLSRQTNLHDLLMAEAENDATGLG